ncbi:MAG: hypothetical protein Q8P22_07930 [Chloroflexota bacterium]|nr:hypothetical protein [Chloroflexota bacterium]
MGVFFDRLVRRVFSPGSARHEDNTPTRAAPLLPVQELPPLPRSVVGSHCPYCGAETVPVPSRKKKCRACGNYVFVKVKPSDRRRYLVTEEQAREIEAEWAQYHRRQKDESWAALNRQLQEAMRRSDWQEMSGLYFQMASQLFEEGRESFRLARLARECKLKAYQESGVVEVVQILACLAESCPACRALHGKRFAIKQALQEMPIPVETCSTWKEEGRTHGWCRCHYAAVIE